MKKLLLTLSWLCLTTMIIQATTAPNISYTGSPKVYPIGTAISSWAPTNSGGAVPSTIPGVVSTLAGGGSGTATDGTGSAASFNRAWDMVTDASGNIYVTDVLNYKIRKITPQGVVTTFAGSGASTSVDGTGTAASFSDPAGITIDASGNLYIAEFKTIRKITPAGVVTTMSLSGISIDPGCGGYDSFQGIAVDASGNLFMKSPCSPKILKITSAGVVSVFAGSSNYGSADGTGAAASFNSINDIVIDAADNLYVSDYNKIRKITPTGVVTTFAGSDTQGSADGTGTAASFFTPYGLTFDALGNLYVAEVNNRKIRKITPAGVVTTLKVQLITNSVGLAMDKTTGNLYLSYWNWDVIGKITLSGYSIVPSLPAGLSMDTTGIISGIPILGASPADYTITGTNAMGSSSSTIHLSFKAPITIPTPGSGTITVKNGNTVVNSGDTLICGTALAVTATPAQGYTLGKITAGGISISNGGTLTFTGPTTITASFSTDVSPNISYAGSPKVYALSSTITPWSPTNSGGTVPSITAGVVTTIAGSGTQGKDDGTGTAASFYYPTGVATDAAGNIYVADQYNYKIRKITPAGVVSTFAGSGSYGSTDGVGTAASFNSPYSVAVDAVGNVYVADAGNRKIRVISPSGVVGTLAGGNSDVSDGTGSTAGFSYPTGVAIDASGNVYVADQYGNRISKITPAGVVTTLAGGSSGSADGTGTAAQFNEPRCIAVDASGNLYVTDAWSKIRKITQAGVVTTLAGNDTRRYVDGIGTVARFSFPCGITVDALGNVYVADVSNNKIRRITPAGVVSTLAGTYGSADGTGTAAGFNGPWGITADGAGNLIVADNQNYKIRKVTTGSYQISPTLPSGLSLDNTGTISGTPTAASPATDYTITAVNGGGSSNNTINLGVGYPVYFSQTNGTVTVKNGNIVINNGDLVALGTVLTVTATPNSGYFVNIVANNINIPNGGAVTIIGNTTITAFGNSPSISYAGSPKAFLYNSANPAWIPTNSGSVVPGIVKKVSLVAGSGLSGTADGTGAAASFNGIYGMTMDASGNLYVADRSNNNIRKITSAGVVSTFAGSNDGTAGSTNATGTAATFSQPCGVAVDTSGNVYVADLQNFRIRKITSAGVVTTFAGGSNSSAGHVDGSATDSRFGFPQCIAVDKSGNVYVSDSYYYDIRKITPAGVVSTLAGTAGTSGYTDGTGTAATVGSGPLVVDAAGNLYLAQYNRIRKITPAGVVTTLAGNSTSTSVDGTGTAASFNYIYSLAIDTTLGCLYVSEYQKIRKVSLSGVVTTIPATFNNTMNSIVISSSKDIYATNYRTISKITLSKGGYSISPKNIPLGLSFDTITGAISGTPTALAKSATYTISATNEYGSGSTIINLGVGYVVKIPTPANGTLTVMNGSTVVHNGDTVAYNTPLTVTSTPNSGYTLGSIWINGVKNIKDGGSFTLLGTTIITANFVKTAGITYTGSPKTYLVGTPIAAWTPTNSGGKMPQSYSGKVSTVVGHGTAGSADGTGSTAYFNTTRGLAVDSFGNIYVADAGNNKIRKITLAGVVTTLAGNGTAGSTDGTGSAATFSNPTDVAIDAFGYIYVADSANNKIRKVSPTGDVSTLAGSGTTGSADGTGTSATFNHPTSIAVDASGNVYVADAGNNKIRKITYDAVVSTLAGTTTSGAADGLVNAATFNSPSGVAVDINGNVYIADAGNNKIRKISSDGTTVSTYAGSTAAGSADATGTAAGFNHPTRVSVDAQGNVYVSDAGNYKIRKITTAGVVSTLAGSGSIGTADSIGTKATFNTLGGTALDASGNLYVADAGNYKVRKITQWGYSISPVLPSGLKMDSTGTISGTPTTVTTVTSYTVTALNEAGSTNTVITLSIGNPTPATVTTQAVASISGTTATGNGTITNLGFPNPSSYGLCYSSTNKTPIISDIIVNNGAATATGAFTGSITGLQPGTTYYVRAYATNTGGTSYGDVVTFTTLKYPTVVTRSISGISKINAVISGEITDLGSTNPTAYGVCYSATNSTPSITDNIVNNGATSTTGVYTSLITSLTAGTKYYVRTYATNSIGTAYGQVDSFTTYQQATVSTQAVSSITSSTAVANGTITGLGIPSSLTAYGFCYSTTSTTPTTSDNVATKGTTTAASTYTASLTGLTMGTTYYVRAYATNASGTSYGEVVSFTTSAYRALSVKVYLQGLFNGVKMNKCLIEDGATPKFTGTIVDTLSVELHSTSNYNTVIYRAHGLELHQDGTVNTPGLSYIEIPGADNGSYYVTIKTRNHLETTSAQGVSLASSAGATYDFTTSANKAYGSNMGFIESAYVIYAGDIPDSNNQQDGLLDVSDQSAIDNQISQFGTGYLKEDLNGDGLVDLSDNAILEANINNFVSTVLP